MNVSNASKGGMIVALISLLLLTVASNTLLLEAICFGGGGALVIRSFRPLFSFGRGFATWLGGGLTGGSAMSALRLIIFIYTDNLGWDLVGL